MSLGKLLGGEGSVFFNILGKEFIVLEIYSSKRLGVRTEIQSVGSRL